MIKQVKPNILIIDDEVDTTELLKKYIEGFGYRVFTAEDGVQGLEILQNENINIIFCDIYMPNMDGMEFLKRLRDISIKAQIIMITGNPTLDKCVEIIERDVCNYLLKPVKREHIFESIQRAERNLNEKQDMINRGLRGYKVNKD